MLFTSSFYKEEKARDILACCQGSSLRDLGRGRHTDSEDDAVGSDGGRRRHDSSDDGSSTGGDGETEARPEEPRLVPGGRRRRGEAVGASARNSKPR
mmetsp:Transcript_13305/g.31462  ORF Transcript_13305/g.31462 Transcript_13305/m.31462 type:complete len:97 (+) Transcript_13305:450-740(+)